MSMGMTNERLMDLQRTVDTLQGRLQDMQWELRRSKQHSLAGRWWKHLLGTTKGNAFMSACCNRRARPNTKMVHHAAARSEQ